MLINRNYIKMCDKAKQLQRAWKPKDWDRFIYRDSEEMDIMMYMEEEYNRKEMIIVNGVYIWLPTQEQLQEIWRKEYLKNPNQHGWFGCFVNFVDTDYRDDLIADEYFGEMNELWLAFVMRERWNKFWTGEKWVKEVIK